MCESFLFLLWKDYLLVLSDAHDSLCMACKMKIKLRKQVFFLFLIKSSLETKTLLEIRGEKMICLFASFLFIYFRKKSLYFFFILISHSVVFVATGWFAWWRLRLSEWVGHWQLLKSAWHTRPFFKTQFE